LPVPWKPDASSFDKVARIKLRVDFGWFFQVSIQLLCTVEAVILYPVDDHGSVDVLP